MDRKQLKEGLIFFQRICAERERPIVDLCVEEAFPGDASTSYIVKVKALWIDEVYCSDALNFLFEVLWQTTTDDFRKNIFSIEILNSNDQLHCWQENQASEVKQNN